MALEQQGGGGPVSRQAGNQVGAAGGLGKDLVLYAGAVQQALYVFDALWKYSGRNQPYRSRVKEPELPPRKVNI